MPTIDCPRDIAFIVQPRRSGKTRELIELSAKTGMPIMVRTHQMAVNVLNQARKLGLEIPKPITPADCERGATLGRRDLLTDRFGRVRVCVDDIDSFFDRYNVAVEYATCDPYRYLVANPSLGNHLKHWWQQRRKR